MREILDLNGEMFINWKAHNVNMSVLLIMIYRYNTVLIRRPTGHFSKKWQVDSKIFIEKQGSEVAKTVLKESRVGDLTVPDFKTYCKTKVIKVVWHWHGQTNKSVEQNRV